MLNEEKSFIAMCKFLLWLITGLFISFIGLAGVFADEIIDTGSWLTYTGRGWSDNVLDSSTNKVFNSNWFKNNYDLVGGVYTPPNQFDYVTLQYFEHSGNYNPCNNASYKLDFQLYYSNNSFVNYVKNFYINDKLCSINDKNSSTGKVNVTCVYTPSSSTKVTLQVNYIDFSSNSTSEVYISRNINATCGLDSGAIIQNNNENTQNIITNNNNNTQQIIDNQNQNTQDIIEANEVCTMIDKTNISTDNRLLLSTGEVGSSVNNNYGVTSFLSIDSNSTITVLSSLNATGTYYCFYDVNKSMISCNTLASLTVNSYLTIPSNASYFRSAIQKSSNKPTYKICKHGNQALNDSLNDDDSSGATSEASNFFSSFNTNTFGLTSIITAPLNLIQSLTSSTCSQLHLPLPYLNNKYLDLPCMTSIYQTHFGAFFTMYQTITYGIIAYWVCVRIFNQVKDFKNPEHDEIEVVDL